MRKQKNLSIEYRTGIGKKSKYPEALKRLNFTLIYSRAQIKCIPQKYEK